MRNADGRLVWIFTAAAPTVLARYRRTHRLPVFEQICASTKNSDKHNKRSKQKGKRS